MTNPAVAVHGLTKIFPVPFHPTRGVLAVKDLSLRIEPGEVYGLLGPNGSGKSTTLKIILGLVSPTHGRTEIFGRDSRLVESREAVWFSPGEPVFLQISQRRGNAAFFWTPLRNDRRNIEEPHKRTARSGRAKQGTRPPVGHIFQGNAATHRTGASIDSRPKASGPG